MNQFIDHNTKCITTTNNIEHSTKKFIKNTSKNIVEEQTIKELQETVKKEPLLICNFFAELIEHEAKNNDVKIFMVLEKGTGGKNALETFRQYLINKLDIREYFQKSHEKPNKKKRKRLKTSKIEVNLNQIKNSV